QSRLPAGAVRAGDRAQHGARGPSVSGPSHRPGGPSVSGPSHRPGGPSVSGPMMRAPELVERALAVTGDPDEVGRVVLVTESSEAVLRWANNTMTTNGHSTSVSWSVISLVRVAGGTAAGVVSSSAGVRDAAEIEAMVRAGEVAARQAGPARDVAEL